MYKEPHRFFRLDSRKRADLPGGAWHSRNFHRNWGAEPTVFVWITGRFDYFEDPDGHSLEYLPLLPESPRPELGVIPLSEWRELHS